MVRRFLTLHRPWLTGLLLALAWLFWADPAQAGCGDYVHINGQPMHGPLHVDGDGPLPAAPMAPCHGPNCSKAPKPQQLPPSTMTPPSAPRDWGILMVDWSLGDPLAQSWDRVESVGTSQSLPQDRDPPPRLV
ncbi:hypothetical protein [Tuwongella immobilis]|uniref:Secreted protein n=1 Tax=Tuwongella immobilis TaxID=692036 RepID=A0A6C2YKV5_9BACT|nr:hypothetical protein [Tuwongella immobilis]VIP01542.1 unnamed protein product [Tuwongella immobilis]VTR98718.1 unnamed protein product [Tuwongella immobilis]